MIWREGFEGRFRVTKEKEQVGREWFTVTSEWRYAGRLELRVLYVEERTKKSIGGAYQGLGGNVSPLKFWPPILEQTVSLWRLCDHEWIISHHRQMEYTSKQKHAEVENPIIMLTSTFSFCVFQLAYDTATKSKYLKKTVCPCRLFDYGWTVSHHSQIEYE